MRKVANMFGYDIYELNQQDCKAHGLVYPCLQAFCDDEKNTAYIKPQYSECDFEDMNEAFEWCKEYSRL